MKTIYILEDESGIREVLEILLSSENYHVKTFPDIKEFNQRDHSAVPDLFILDVMLPDGLGTEVCNQIRSERSTSKIPIIIMSAHANLTDIDKSCSPNDFISKPFDLNTPLTKVGKMTNLN